MYVDYVYYYYLKCDNLNMSDIWKDMLLSNADSLQQRVSG
jgi:hypothetical protein